MHLRLRWFRDVARAQVSALVVLAGLAVLAGWGYAHNWEAPTLSALLGNKKEADKDKKSSGDKEEEKGGADSADAGSRPLSAVELKSPETAAKAGFAYAPVEERPLAEYVTANTVLAYDEHRYARLSARAFGVAWSVEKHAGDRVKKGDVLGIVSAAEVGRAKADFLSALAQVDVRKKMLRRAENAASALPEREIVNLRNSLREADINLINTHQALLNLGFSIRLEDVTGLSDREAASRLRLLGLPRDVTDRNDPATLTANLLPLTSPLDGLVIDHNMSIGEVIDPVRTQTQFVVADVRSLWALLDVRLEDVGKLALDQEVTFRSDADSRKATGKLGWISAEVDPKTRTVKARIDIDNPDERLRPGTFGTASVVVRQHRAAAVPDEAVQWDGDNKRYLVFVRVSDQVFQPRVIKRGLRIDGYTQVLDGVSPGVSVVTTGSHVLKSEMLKDRIGGEE